MLDLPDVDATVRKIEALVDRQPESAELVQLLMQLYGAGLSRVMQVIREQEGDAILERIADDKLTASLLLLHGLHPIDAETRVRKALKRLERRFESQRVSLEAIEEGVARIRVDRDGGTAAPAELAEMIERAAMEAAPELDAIEIAGAVHGGALVQIAPAPAA